MQEAIAAGFQIISSSCPPTQRLDVDWPVTFSFAQFIQNSQGSFCVASGWSMTYSLLL